MQNLIIKLIKTNLLKNPNTKTTYFEDKKETTTITEQEYKYITHESTIKYFRSLGGGEYKEKSYTAYGYTTTRLTSTSPNKEKKTIREFEFKYQ